MKTILLADDNRKWLDVLEMGLSREPGFDVVAKTYDGKETIERIEALRPDIIILDIIMPEFDGVYIVNHIRQSIPDYRPVIYILSGIGTDTIIKIINDLEVAFYSMKPVTIETVTARLKTITGNPAESAERRSAVASPVSRQDRIKSLLSALGFPPHLFSTKCMQAAVCTYVNDTNSQTMLTKALYPDVAAQLGVSASSIEKNLRASIAQMQRANTPLYQTLFPHARHKKVSNGEFLAIASEHLRTSA